MLLNFVNFTFYCMRHYLRNNETRFTGRPHSTKTKVLYAILLRFTLSEDLSSHF